MRREDPFRSGFVRRLYAAKHKSGAKRPVESDGRENGGEAMVTNGIETFYCDGRHWETMKSAARRYGVSDEVVSEHLKKELFWADDPRTGIRMVCGVLEKREERNGGASFWMVLGNLLVCPTNRVGPNLMWGLVWGTVVVLLASYVSFAGGCLFGLGLGIVKFIYAVKWDMEHPQEVRPVVYVDDGCYGGDGFFDEVSTRRREDLQFLLGTGKYAKENW